MSHQNTHESHRDAMCTEAITAMVFIEPIPLYAAFEVRVFLVNWFIPQGKRGKLALLFNPYMRERRRIHSLPKGIC